MKSCPNCSKDWPVDYAGTCDGCGAALGSGFRSSNFSAASPEEKDAQLRQSMSRAQRDASMENAIAQSRGATPSGLSVPTEVALSYSGGIANELVEAFGNASSDA